MEPTGTIICRDCKSPIRYWGNASDARWEKQGFRKVDGEWVCMVCTGLLGDQVRHNPELAEFLGEALKRIKDETPGSGPEE